MNKNRRNIIIAVILLVLLIIMPFWSKIRQAVAPESGESAGICWVADDWME